LKVFGGRGFTISPVALIKPPDTFKIDGFVKTSFAVTPVSLIKQPNSFKADRFVKTYYGNFTFIHPAAKLAQNRWVYGYYNFANIETTLRKPHHDHILGT
jgi:hypothetical protein